MVGRARHLPVGALALLASCGLFEYPQPFAPTPWPSDRTVVLVIADRRGEPVEGGPEILAPGESIRMTLTGEHRLWAWAFAPPASGGPDLAGCGVTLGGTGKPVPVDAATRWVSTDFVGSESERVEWEEEPEPPWDLRFADPRCGATICDRVRLERQTSPLLAGFNIRAVTFLSPDELVIGGSYALRAPKNHAVELFRWRRGQEPISLGLGPRVQIWSIATDRQGTAWAGASDGLYRAGLDGSGLTKAATGAHQVAEPAEGLVVTFAYDSGPVRRLSGTSTMPELPRALRALQVLGPDSMVGFRDERIDWFEGGRWREEEAPGYAFDYSSRAAVGPLGDALVVRRAGDPGSSHDLHRRARGATTWQRVPAEPDLDFLAVASVGGLLLAGGSATFVFGSTGFLFAFDSSSAPCEVESARTSAPVTGIVFREGRGVVIVDAMSAVDPSSVFWLTVDDER